jgi:predicted oxidoreductase
MGFVKPWPFPVGHHISSGYLKTGKTIEELAGNIGVDAKTLSETVARYNKHAPEGRDPEFKRGEDSFSRYMGDFTAKPSTTVGPLLKAPFYAVELRPGDLSTFAGLDTDEEARVLDGAGKVIPGLFAIGLDMNPVGRGDYPSGGFGLGPGMTFGYRVAMHVAHA